MREPDLRLELLALDEEDRILRGRSPEDGSLIGLAGHPCLEDLHKRNVARLRAVVITHGWPGRGLVGEDGAEAAWRFVQHAVDDPALQREALGWLQAAAVAGEIPAWQPAMLEDRILVLEGRPQRYGTQWEFDADGDPAPCRIEDEVGVDDRRARIGLGPIVDELRRLRSHGTESRGVAPAAEDRAAWKADFTAWARRVGWRA